MGRVYLDKFVVDSRERNTKSTMTKAAIESTIATALGSTQGSCRPVPLNSTEAPETDAVC